MFSDRVPCWRWITGRGMRSKNSICMAGLLTLSMTCEEGHRLTSACMRKLLGTSTDTKKAAKDPRVMLAAFQVHARTYASSALPHECFANHKQYHPGIGRRQHDAPERVHDGWILQWSNKRRLADGRKNFACPARSSSGGQQPPKNFDAGFTASILQIEHALTC